MDIFNTSQAAIISFPGLISAEAHLASICLSDSLFDSLFETSI